jgi:hypothetical protein
VQEFGAENWRSNVTDVSVPLDCVTDKWQSGAPHQFSMPVDGYFIRLAVA